MKSLRARTSEILAGTARKIWVIGKTGQVAQALATELTGSTWESKFFPRQDVDLEFPDKVPRALDALLADHFRPDVLLVAAAYTQVDQAEKDFDLALRINSRSVGEIARWCADLKIPLVHISTDYVFPGEGTRPWREDDATDPLNAYGRSKVVGEMEISQILGKASVPFQIFRTSWVYDHVGKNFFTTMLRLGADREEIKVVSDQIGAPTYAPHLAQALICGADALLGAAPLTGIFHFSGRGEISWHEFAARIFQEARPYFPLKIKSIVPIPTDEYPTPARRPRNSRFDLNKFQTKLGVSVPDWESGLRECLARKTAH